VPADATLVECRDLQTDESLLSGESVPVRKIAIAAGANAAAQRPGGDDLPHVFSGTLVVRGTGIAEVTATGPRSEIGRIGQSLSALEVEPPRLRTQTQRLVRVFAMVGAGVSALAVVLYGTLRGGWLDAFLMRLCDVMLSFPAILVALLIAGVGRALFPNAHESLAFGVLILSITLTGWVQYARTVRGATLVERNKEYVQAARVTGVAPLRIMRRHVLPNVLGPVLVLATIQVATAIITEATLSFLGVGVPPTSPSLGTLIRVGNDFLFSGEWWITVFPGLMLILIALSVNLLGDWLRDALNPRLR
jgi:ABC-type dipeptide/oligopeptide/nickel transport system permease subunit